MIVFKKMLTIGFMAASVTLAPMSIAASAPALIPNLDGVKSGDLHTVKSKKLSSATRRKGRRKRCKYHWRHRHWNCKRRKGVAGGTLKWSNLFR